MKKILPVIILMAFVWSCTKKMTPARSESPTSNTGSVSSTTQSMPPQTDLGKGTTSTTTSTTTSASTVNPDLTTTTAGSKTPPTATTPGAAAAIAGQSTYNNKCGSCHGLKVTTNYTADRWASILAVMAPRARLTDTERENVYAYVKENSKK